MFAEPVRTQQEHSSLYDHTHAHTRTYTHTHTRTHTRVRAHTHTRAPTYCTHTHARTHTRAHTAEGLSAGSALVEFTRPEAAEAAAEQMVQNVEHKPDTSRRFVSMYAVGRNTVGRYGG